MEFAHFGIAHGICAWNLRILELRMEFAHGICAWNLRILELRMEFAQYDFNHFH